MDFYGELEGYEGLPMPKLFSASEPRSSPLNMKTTKGLRARLEASAAKSGRALTHEAEHRVEQALDFDREFGGQEAAEIYNNVGRFLRLFNVSAFTGETYLAREALKAAFSAFIDRALPDPGGGLAGDGPPAFDQDRIREVKKISKTIADAVFAAGILESYASMQEAHGDDAPRLFETLVQFAERADLFSSEKAASLLPLRKNDGATE